MKVEMSTTADLGDAGINDGSADRARNEHYFALTAKRWLRPEMLVLEVGPGDGFVRSRRAARVRAGSGGTCCTVVATRSADSMVIPLEQALGVALAAAARVLRSHSSRRLD
jgi:hypothetical protein